MILIICDTYDSNKLLKNILISSNLPVEEVEYKKNNLINIDLSKNYKLILLNIKTIKDNYKLLLEIKHKINVPVIFFNSIFIDDSKLYKNLIDAYIDNPFSINLLVSIINKFYNKISLFKTYRELKLKSQSKSILINNKMITLAAKERDILFYLEENKEILKNRIQILDAVWGNKFKGDLRVVDKHIAKLRKNLGDSSIFIKTIKEGGYMFSDLKQ